MSKSDDDPIENRLIRAHFKLCDPKVVARVAALSEADASDLPTDPKALADDLQTVAGLALTAYENAEMMMRLIEQINKAGGLRVVSPNDPPKPGRF